MSDLQCPATLVMVPSEISQAQVHHLVEQVRTRRVAAVYSSRAEAAVRSAELAASELGLQPALIEGLDESSAGFREAIGGISDIHRGESVVVFIRGDVMAQATPLAARRLVPGDASSEPAVIEIEVDADGWRPAPPNA
jgi:broad specificity phosphatase PhoE